MFYSMDRIFMEELQSRLVNRRNMITSKSKKKKNLRIIEISIHQ